MTRIVVSTVNLCDVGTHVCAAYNMTEGSIRQDYVTVLVSLVRGENSGGLILFFDNVGAHVCAVCFLIEGSTNRLPLQS